MVRAILSILAVLVILLGPPMAGAQVRIRDGARQIEDSTIPPNKITSIAAWKEYMGLRPGTEIMGWVAPGAEGNVLVSDGNGAWVSAAGGGGGAPFSATYITQTPHALLDSEQALSLLSTGILKSTTATGVLSIAEAGVDYASAGHNHGGTYEPADAAIQTHIDNVAGNPHNTTAAQVGAEPANANIQSHIATVTGNPHAVTKANVGLGNVTNDAQVKALGTAPTLGNLVTWGSDGATVVDSGVAPSAFSLDGHNHTGDYQPADTDLTETAALNSAAIDSGKVVRVAASGALELHVPAAADVGLGNVDNTSDLDKPISNDTQAALDDKQPLDSDLTAIAAITYTEEDARKVLAVNNSGDGWVIMPNMVASWGYINGTLSNQSDVSNALAGKQAADADDLSELAATNAAVSDAGKVLKVDASGAWVMGADNTTGGVPVTVNLLEGDGAGGVSATTIAEGSLALKSLNNNFTESQDITGGLTATATVRGNTTTGTTTTSATVGVSSGATGTGVYGQSTSGGTGVHGSSATGIGVNGGSTSGTGVNGSSVQGVGGAFAQGGTATADVATNTLNVNRTTTGGAFNVTGDLIRGNDTATGATHTGSLIRLQHDSADKFRVDLSGNTILSGNLTVPDEGGLRLASGDAFTFADASNTILRVLNTATWADTVTSSFFQFGAASVTSGMVSGYNGGALVRYGIRTNGMVVSPNTTGTMTAPACTLEVQAKDAVKVPVGNATTERPASPAVGMIRYNNVSNAFEGYSGASPSWQSLGGVAGGGTLELSCVVDGAGGPVTGGNKARIVVPATGQITRLTMLADQSETSLTASIGVEDYATFDGGATSDGSPATIALTGAVKNQATGLTKAVTAGQVLTVNLTGNATNATNVAISVQITKS